MTGELGKDSKGSRLALREVPSRNFLAGLMKNTVDPHDKLCQCR
jgi:hypothetical protein